jgi:hypothetical protein
MHHTTQSARTPQHRASSYNCITQPQTNHCYGTINWYVTPDPSIGAYGSSIDQQVPSITCTDPGCYPRDLGGRGDLISNEMWLADTSHWALAQCSPTGGCWVEEGVVSYGNSPAAYYFWADERPCISDPSLRFAVHYVSSSLADSGYFIESTINTSTSTSTVTRDCSHKSEWTWNTSVYSEHAGAWVFLNAHSTDMPFWPYIVAAGIEIQGTGNQSASLNQYQNAQYIYGGVWNLVDQSGCTCGNIRYLQNGPQASWWTTGSPLGYWRTTCGC